MELLYIETFTRVMKKKGITQGTGKHGSDHLTVDLNSLSICLGDNIFELARIPGTKGGYRYFFLCPDCGRRCRKLYKRYLFYACGNCQQIHKQTLNRSKTDCQYYFELAFKEARKIDPSYYPQKGYVDYDNFPSRPKGMRVKTYWKHYRKFTSYLDKGVSYWLGGLK